MAVCTSFAEIATASQPAILRDRFLPSAVWRLRQEAVDEVRSRDRLRLGAAIAFELGPGASERKQRPVLVEREPNHVFPAGGRVPLRRVLSAKLLGARQRVLRPAGLAREVLRTFVTAPQRTDRCRMASTIPALFPSAGAPQLRAQSLGLCRAAIFAAETTSVARTSAAS
jgi:hypothetical protein